MEVHSLDTLNRAWCIQKVLQKRFFYCVIYLEYPLSEVLLHVYTYTGTKKTQTVRGGEGGAKIEGKSPEVQRPTRQRNASSSTSVAPDDHRPPKSSKSSKKSAEVFVYSYLQCTYKLYHSKHDNTVEPPNKGHVGTRSFVLYREVSLIRRLKSTGIIGIGTSRFVLYREVSFIWNVLYRRFNCTCGANNDILTLLCYLLP